MKYKTLDDFNFRGKRVLVRSDLNSPVVKGRVINNSRIEESALTIAELKRKGAKVVILAHQSRPSAKDFISLKQHAKLLNKYSEVKFVDDIIGKKAVSKILKLKNGEALLLENVRFLKEEFFGKKENALIEVLGNLCEIYVNDAFSVSHRVQSSITGFPKVMSSCVGRLMEKEIESLGKLKKGRGLFILGGAKIEDDLKLANKWNRVLACGMFGQLELVKRGFDLGKDLRKFRNVTIGKNVVFPVDFAFEENGKRKEFRSDEFARGMKILDIGSETVTRYVEEIRKAKFVFMKGPAGFFEDGRFSFGTNELLKAVSKCGAFSVLGGGHLTVALDKIGISKKKFGYVSLSGGALIAYLAGEKLPGLEALKRGSDN